MSSINIKGLAELQAALDTLPAKIEANIARGALRAGAKIIVAEAKRNVHSVSGLLAAGIRVSSSRINRRSGKVTTSVIAGAKATKAVTAYYAHMVEFGTAAHVIRARKGGLLAIGVPKVNHPGARPKPFMRPAFDTQARAAVEAAREYIRQRLLVKHGIDVPGPDSQADA